ncbi:MAG TPA: hypothetical protein PK177_21210 [Burkholderiaceae bacterium]|nr:hypothetical protein [Burkholderiaceae bacterium]
MNARRLFRRYMKLVSRSPVSRHPLASAAADAASAAGLRRPSGAAHAAEPDGSCELLERRRQFAGWVH